MVIMVISPHKDNHGLTPPQQMSVPGDEGIRSSLRDSSQTCKGCFIMHIMNGQQSRLSLMKIKTITLVTLFSKKKAIAASVSEYVNCQTSLTGLVSSV